MANQPTIVAASLDDSQMKQSIANLVASVKRATNTITKDFDSAVDHINAKLKELGTGSTASAKGGGSANTTKQSTQAVEENTDAIKRNAQAVSAAAAAASQQAATADKQIKKNQEVSMSFDQMAKAQHEAFAAQQSKRYGTSELQNLRMEQHRIEAELSKAQSAQTSNPAFLKALEETRTRLHELARLRSELESKPLLNASEVKNLQYIRSEYERVNNLMRELSQQKSAGFTIPNDMTEKITRLRNEYEQIKEKIRSIGQALIDEDFKQIVVNTNLEAAKKLEQDRTQEIQKQVGLIQSRKDANTAFEKVSAMPTASIEQAKEKLQLLLELKEKVANTPLFSNSKGNQLNQVIAQVQHRIEGFEKQAGKGSASLDAMNEQIKKNIQLEEQRRKETIQAGVAAQQSYISVITEMKKSLDIDTNKPIMGIKELDEQIRLMSQAYWSMDKADRESPIGLSLKRDLENARKVGAAIQQYNKEVAGISSGKASTSNIDKHIGSYERLSNLLSNLTEQYRRMGREERGAEAGNGLADKIQRTSREIQKIQQQMNRPINFDKAMEGAEKTLDDIAYKMQRLRAYRQGIDITKPNAANDIKQVDDALAKLQRDMDKYMSKSKQVNEINTALGRSWNYMKNRLAFYFTVGATTQFVKSLVDIRGQYELLERSIGILVDSAQNGSRIFAELNAMAIKSPFTTMELGAAAKQLVAYDVAAKDVVDTTKRLADMAAAVGVPIERLTYALGQIKSYSYLNARDARMFANTGIPLVKNLADMYTKLEGRLVSTSDVYDRIKKKAVSYNDVMKVINEMTDEGGKFFNFQEKAADTLKVKIANLTLAYNNMMNEIGRENQGLISGGLGGLKTLMEHWRDVVNTIESLPFALAAGAVAFGILQVAVNKTTAAEATQMLMTEGLKKKWLTLTTAIKSMTLASLGIGVATAAISALVLVLAKLTYDYYDLKQANEDFNKSVADGAEENIRSITKFFDDYKKELKGISGASSSDQFKMWERMREEIEKTIHNAQDYLDILNEIDDTAARIKVGEKILNQQQVIEQEIKDFASRGAIDMGGGFADDSMAEDLKQYDDALKDIAKDYGTIGEAAKKTSTDMFANRAIERAISREKEASAEMDIFIEKLQKLDFDKIMGDFDKRTQFTNIRNAIDILRDGFLATEQGSKIAYEGQALLNMKLDAFIASLGRSKKLIQDVTINGKKYSASQVAAIEANRSAWEKFFSRLKPNQKKMLDFAIKTNQMSSKQLQEIWDYAAKEMQKTDLTAFSSIQDHIAQLRNTPDIILNVVYKERTEEETDAVIKDYKKHFMTPKLPLTGMEDLNAYADEEEKLYKKYGTLIKKSGESHLEWGERVFKTVHDEEKNVKDAAKALIELQKELTTEEKRAKDARYQALLAQKKESEEIIKNAKEVIAYEKLHDKEKKKGKQKDPILDALKLETELVEKLNAEYEGLMKNGAKSPEALASLHKTFGKTISQLNSQLKSFGLPQLDLAKILVGRNPKKQLEHFQKTLDSLVKNGLLNMERSKVVEAVIEKVGIRAENYDLTELSKGIEKELNKLKESFDLGTALDAEPQLGNLFAKMYGFDTKELPRTFTELVQKAQSIIDNAFKGRDEARIDVSAILDKNAFEEWVKGTERELDSSLVQTVQKMRDYLVETQRKMVSDANKNYDKLLERYSEYQFKLIKIDKDSAADRLALIRKFATAQQSELVKNAANIANQITLSTDPEERERLSKELQDIVKKVAGDNRVVLQIGVGIDNKEAAEKAQVAFDEFTKNPEWKTAIGDLEGMTHNALRMLIRDLEDFIKTNKKLTTKQIRQIEGTITKLHKQIRKNNPFAALNDTIEEAENRTKEYEDMITKMSEELATLEIIPEQKRTKDQQEQIAKLTEAIKKYKKEIQEVGKIDMGAVFGDINSAISSISEITSSVTKLLDAIGGEDATKASETISNIVGNMEAAGRGAQIGSSFGGYGAAIGAVAGGLTDLATRLADVMSGNKEITEKVVESEREVKKLTSLYNKLEYAIKSAYGDGEMAAKGLLIANKKLQLAQLETQLELEKSRKKKNRDEDKILDLQEQVDDAKRELKEMADEVTESFLNISSVKDAVSSMIDGIISALKNGENAMDSFTDSWEEMCWNMIKQVISTEILAPKFKKIFDEINDEVNKRGEKAADDIVKAKEDYESNKEYVQKWSNWYVRKGDEFKRAMNYYDLQKLYKEGWVDSSFDEWDAAQQKHIKDLEDAYTNATSWTLDDVERYAELLKSMQSDYEAAEEATREAAERLGLRMGDKSQALSALQAGIQGITEDTANALEAYMNGVSQQVYAHTALLTEIRDAVVAFNGDATLGVQSQMLLQLQNNYILMQTMQTLMENWTVPSGNGIRVELMS